MFSKSLHEIEVAAICFVMEYGLEYNTCACGMNSKSKDFEYVGSVTSSFPTFQGKIKVINSASRVIIGQRNINISEESNRHFTPFSSFWCGDLHLCGKKLPVALDTWKIVARALFKLVWKSANSRLWSFVWSWLVMFWIFYRESLFLTRILQNFVLTEPGMVMSHLSDDYFSGQPSGNLDHSVIAHWFLKFVLNSRDFRR